ncbi:MAG: hypothetical protein KH354_03975 [Clostridiales bacterium]|nr:hypothetical protein [Clostridiales bacterium]
MAIDLNSAGVSLQYAPETTAGTRPTTGYIAIKGLKSIPELDPKPETHDTTTLDAKKYKTYISGLKDPGGALQFSANNTEEFHSQWETLMDAYETAKETGKSIWFVVVIPGLTRAFYLSGEPAELGLSAIEVDSVLEINPYITPNNIHGWDAKPTTT